MLAVFVVSAGAVGVAIVSDVGSDTDDIVVSVDLTANGTDLRVSHLGGDTLSNDGLTAIVRAGGNVTRYAFAPPAGQFDPGDERTFSDALVANTSNEVRLVYEPSGSEIARTTLRPAPEPDAERGAIEGVVVAPGASSIVASGASFAVRPAVTPLRGATVVVEGVGKVAEARTGAGGAYRIKGLEPGSYGVSAAAPGLAVSAATATVEANETTTVDLRLDPLRPAEFDVAIDALDATVDAGETVTVDATVENVGDEAGTQDVELRVGDEVVSSTTVELDGGERRTVSSSWQTLPTDVGEQTLTVDAGDDAATTTVDVLGGETDSVAYVDADEDGDPDERLTAVELAFLGPVEGHLVVFDDVTISAPIGAQADRVTVQRGVTVRASEVRFEADGDVTTAGAAIDTSARGVFVADAGDVTLSAGGDLDARDSTVTASASAFLADAGDVELNAGRDADLRDGTFEATGYGLFAGDGRITATAGRTVRTDGASFDPELA